MTQPRAEILRRIRAAVTPDRPLAPVPRHYRRAGDVALPNLVALFTDRLIDYRAGVTECPAGEVPARLAAVLLARGIDEIAVPDGFPAPWLTDVATSVRARSGASIAELDAVGGTVTRCATAIAETGTIVLDGGSGQGARAMSLIPDYLLVVVLAEQIVPTVPDAVAVLDPRRPLTWISGPSATSDIELQRVEGVHGPRTLDVLLVAAEGSRTCSAPLNRSGDFRGSSS